MRVVQQELHRDHRFTRADALHCGRIDPEPFSGEDLDVAPTSTASGITPSIPTTAQIERLIPDES
jgi:hypothetical protein